MLGAMFRLGEIKPRPGIYVRWYNDGGYSRFARPLGVGAAVIKSNWGPLNELFTLNPADDIKMQVGTGKGANVVAEIFNGGASFVRVVRVGNGGNVATAYFETSDEVGFDVRTKYPTSRQFSITIRDALDVTQKELLAFENGRQIESFVFPKGGNEAEILLEMINTRSNYFVATSESQGELEIVLNRELTGGKDPTVTGEDYTNGLRALETKFFDSVTVDVEDPAIHAAVHAFVRRKLQEGYRVTGFVGQLPSVDFETRKTEAKSFNDFAMTYVANGFETATGEVVGAEAAARVLGMFVSGSYKSSLTKRTITGATGIVGELKPDEYNEAATNGMLVFSINSDGIPQIDYGINTLVSIGPDEDEGWKKLRRVRTRYELIDRIVVQFDRAMRNQIDNEPDGHQFLITLANGEIDQMIREKGLLSGRMILDPTTAPEGDSAWFTFEDLVDLDGLEKAYLSFGFRY